MPRFSVWTQTVLTKVTSLASDDAFALATNTPEAKAIERDDLIADIAGDVLDELPLTTDGDLLTQAAGARARLTRADLAADIATDSAFTGAFADIASEIPTGGATGQVLAKVSGSDYDTAWVTPYPTKIFLGPNDLINTVGSPVRGRSAEGAWLRWQMPNSATTVVEGTFDVPLTWNTFNVKFGFMGATGGASGDIRFLTILRNGPAVVGGIAGTTNTASIPNLNTSYVVTVGAQWEVVEHTDTRGPFNAVAGALYTTGVVRLGADATDTYAGAIDLIYIMLERAS
jgi:hypothetical protein